MRGKVIALILLFVSSFAFAQTYTRIDDYTYRKTDNSDIKVDQLLEDLNKEIKSLESINHSYRSLKIQEYGKKKYIQMKYNELKLLDNAGVDWSLFDKSKYEAINWDNL